jgi:hypothetical protein
MPETQAQRILIWGKTYPELSERHRETVCTGGCFEDGTPVRIYPVPLRYLPEFNQYRLYDWIEVPVGPSTRDRRPESHKVLAPDRLKVVSHLDSDDGWLERRRVIFANRDWHYECLEDLKARQRREGTSMGLVKVGEVSRVWLEERGAEERRHHAEKLARLRAKLDLFDTAPAKHLAFFPFKVRIEWRCERRSGPRACPGHTAAVMDWGLGELGRREGGQVALARMQELANVDKYDLRLYMGNFKAHPRNFGVVGLWYPLIRHVQRNAYVQESLL